MKTSVLISITSEPGFENVLNFDLEQASELARRLHVPYEPGLRLHVASGLPEIDDTSETNVNDNFVNISPNYTYHYYRGGNIPPNMTIAKAGKVARNFWPADVIQTTVQSNSQVEDEELVPSVELYFGRLLVSISDIGEQERMLKEAIVEGVMAFMPDDHMVYRGIKRGELPKKEDCEKVIYRKKGLIALMGFNLKDNLASERASIREYEKRLNQYYARLNTREEHRMRYVGNLSNKFYNLVSIV